METLVTDPLVTKDGIRVEIGQLWMDLDKRHGLRQCCVVEVDSERGRARLKDMNYFGGNGRWTSVSRMHKHSSGWAPVK